jgi:hypothetical protein
MKKGKTSKIQGFKSMKVTYGTVDSVNLKSIYLNIQTWVQPIKESLNWSRVVLNMCRAIKHVIYDILDQSLFDDKFIVDLDLRSSGLVIGKKSFLNLEINFYLKNNETDFKSQTLKTHIKKMSKSISQEIFNKNEYFKFSLKKTIKPEKEKISQTPNL